METFGRFWAIQDTRLAIYGAYKWALGQKLGPNTVQVIPLAIFEVYQGGWSPFWPKLGLNWLVLAQFGRGSLFKSRILLHFLAKIIYGSFWEIFCCASHFVGDLCGFSVDSRATFWSKLGLNGLILAPPCLLIKSRVLLHFLVKLIYGSFWDILSCANHSVGDLCGLSVGSGATFWPKLELTGLILAQFDPC